MIKVLKDGNLWATFEDIISANNSIKFERNWYKHVWEITL